MISIPHGRVVDSVSGNPVAGAQVMIYDATGKLHSTLTTNDQGEFPTSFPKGEYGATIHAVGYVLDAEASFAMPKTADVMYDGGTFIVAQDDEPIDMIVPVKKNSDAKRPSSGLLRSLWGTLQFEMSKRSRKNNSSYGIVRDAVTHEPLDLAVIRLFDEASGQLIETKISDTYGKFSLFPSPGTYKVTVSREGYEDAVREHVKVSAAGESKLLDPVDLNQKPVV